MSIRQQGRRTWIFDEPPGIVGTAAVGGPREGRGPLAADFDQVLPDLRAGAASFEQAEQQMEEMAARLAIAKADLTPEQISLMFAGDLINQLTPSNFTARSLGIPYLGLFSACATAVEGLTLAALAASSGVAEQVLVVSGSHTCTAERQFRYPNEYGCQKPPHSQTTATAAGAAVVAAGSGPVAITAVTVGRVCDEHISDPFAMGAAMAPAFADTVQAHLHERGLKAADYDLIVSGDLGRVGQGIACELLQAAGISGGRLEDCGLLLYGDDKQVFAGGSGCGCAAAVGFGHLCRLLREGQLRRILLCATGALLSPLSCQQCESIPAISHAVALERRC